MSTLIITADDYGYSQRYDEGILEAARAGAVDSVSAMVLREGLNPAPLLATGVEVGLHLELSDSEERTRAEVSQQLESFRELFGRQPAYLDGHRHSHASAATAPAVAEFARQQGLPLRSVDPQHRRLLRHHGVATPDLLIGRMSEEEPPLPAELSTGTSNLPDGVIEWMVHPGHRGPEPGSSYDRGREEDLSLLLSFETPPGVDRAAHSRALTG